jgi:cytochrome oxidase Cu insertion factor (SCO1/SenC/PrrC family)
VNMDSGFSPSDPTIVAAFQSALLHQALIAAAILALLWLAWGASRNWIDVSDNSKNKEDAVSGPNGVSGLKGDAVAGLSEPVARRWLRVSFGVLWLFDGILQAQPQMPIGLPSQVIAPSVQSSPGWVGEIVNWGATGWSYHPIQAAAAAVWVQVGIGLWLLVAAHGRWSQLAGAASVAWGLLVWVFGESFGGIFGPGLSWLTGAPGAAVLYVAAGVLLALPASAWRTRRPGQVLLGLLGLFFLGMAALQAWPGNGFWQNGNGAALASMPASMAQTSQPKFLSALLTHFGSFAASNAFAVNMVVVVVLVALGAACLVGAVRGPSRLVRAVVIAGAVCCLAVWVLFQDFGFFGGLGTDPNSMVPTVLLLAAGYRALTPAPASATEPEPEPAPAPETEPEQPAVPAWRRVLAATSFSSVTALGALAIVVLGAAPMASASLNRTADPILAEALAGYSPPLQEQAPGFRLTDQDGKTVTLASLRGKVVLLTFLDPVCTSDCTLMGREFLQAGQLLAGESKHVELVGVVVNPVYYSREVVDAFDQQEGLTALPNWEYLTATPARLAQVWKAYGITGEVSPAGSMIAHNDMAFVIDQKGRLHQEVDFDPGPGTSATISSFAGLLSGDARQLLGASS